MSQRRLLRRYGSVLWQVARCIALAYLIVLLVIPIFENSLLYFPQPYRDGPQWHPPGLHFEDAWFKAADGTLLHGWYCPHDKPRAVVLFAHGNAGNVTDRADIVARWQRELRVSILIFDYRGYGRSEGKPSERGLYADGRAARMWLAHRAGVAEREIVLCGRSLGGGVSVDLAVDGARGLVLENTFTSVPDVAAHHYPWLPARLLMRNRYDSLSKIARYHGPLLESHCEVDDTVPMVLGRRLFEAANEPKQFYIVTGSGHNDMPPDEYYQVLDRFLEKLP